MYTSDYIDELVFANPGLEGKVGHDKREFIPEFLSAVRDEGSINMFESGLLLMTGYFLTRAEAREAVLDWMKNV